MIFVTYPIKWNKKWPPTYTYQLSHSIAFTAKVNINFNLTTNKAFTICLLVNFFPFHLALTVVLDLDSWGFLYFIAFQFNETREREIMLAANIVNQSLPGLLIRLWIRYALELWNYFFIFYHVTDYLEFLILTYFFCIEFLMNISNIYSHSLQVLNNIIS